MDRDTLKLSAYSRGCGVRHAQVLLHILFYVIIYGIQTSLSVVIIGMVYAPRDEIKINLSPGMIVQALSSYLYGFLVTELFGGWVCKRYGFKWPMVILMIIISAVTVNLPTISEGYGYGGLIFCRVVQGLCAGLAFSMPAEFVSKWIPIEERTTLGMLVYSSGLLGEVLGVLLSSYISASQLGWPFVYTQYGYLAIIWAVLMAIFGGNSPEEYTPKISEGELNYIVQNRGSVRLTSTAKIPWKQIFTSTAFWAIVVAEIGASWMTIFRSGNGPIYLAQFFNVRNINVLLMIMTFICWILSYVFSKIAQLLINKGRTTIQQSRKIFYTIGCVIPAILIILILIVPEGSEFVGVAVLVIIYIASVGTIFGSRLNCNDITSNFAPIVFGIASWLGQIFAIIAISILSQHIFDIWSVTLLFTAILLLITCAF